MKIEPSNHFDLNKNEFKKPKKSLPNLIALALAFCAVYYWFFKLLLGI